MRHEIDRDVADPAHVSVSTFWNEETRGEAVLSRCYIRDAKIEKARTLIGAHRPASPVWPTSWPAPGDGAVRPGHSPICRSGARPRPARAHNLVDSEPQVTLTMGVVATSFELDVPRSTTPVPCTSEVM